MSRHCTARRSRRTHGTSASSKFRFSLPVLAAAVLAAVAFGGMVITPKPAQASCNFNSFWTGGCDKELTRAVNAVNRAAHPLAPPLNCGRDGQRPCNIWERVPSCDFGLKEDFHNRKCVKLAKGEWSPFFAGLKSLGEETASFSDEALKKLD